MQRQQGVALITILLVVVIATILGVTMTTEQHFAINRARTFFDQGIVRQYAYGGEELARQILHQDFLDSPEQDHVGENWAAKDLAFDFEEGRVELLIEDLSGRLNVNTLLATDAGATLARQRLLELMNVEGIDPAMADRVLDWIDPDTGTNPQGAEDFDYLGQERPYRTANQPMLDLSELRLIQGMTPEMYEVLRLSLCALPDPNTPINVNTASIGVLQAIAQGLSRVDAESLVYAREQNPPFTSAGEFAAAPELGGAANAVKVAGLGVQSSFFQVSVRARYQDRFGYLTSIIQRNPTNGSLSVIYRDISKKILSVVAETPTDGGSDNG